MTSIYHQYNGFISSKPLWNGNALFELSQLELKNFECAIKDLTTIKIRDNEVLGKRIEHFFEYYINSSKDYQLLVKNLQIFKDKITIGELDFVIEDTTKKCLLHIELVYKFYLYDPQRSKNELERWVGPDQKDSLLEKVAKLKHKQFPLLYQSETIKALQKLDISTDTIKQKVSFFGQLFIPLSFQNKILPNINNDCISGFWIYRHDFNSEKYQNYQYYIPSKKDWVTNPKDQTIWHSYNTILESIEVQLSKKKSPLLWIKSNEDSYAKCFIVWW